LHFLAFDQIRTPISLHFLFSNFSIFLTTYPPLNANVICEGSLRGIQNIVATYKKAKGLGVKKYADVI
jgi:hypothetical protein